MIQACPICGSTALRIPQFRDGLVPETDNLGEWVCTQCGRRTIPVEFDDEEALEAFRRALDA